MRIPAPQARAVQRGAKTVHRVPVDTRLTARPLRPANRHGGRPFHPHHGDVLTIHGGHRDPALDPPKWVTTETVHCKIVAVDRAPLGLLTDEQAQAEGYNSAEEFEIDFVERHDRPWLDTQIAELIEHAVPHADAVATRPEWARRRYEHRWAFREAWILTIKSFHDMPLLLPGLPHEPEAIPVERIKRRWTDRADKRHAAAIADIRELDRRLLTQEQRLAQLHRTAHLRGVDVSRELWLLRRRLPTLSKDSLERHVRSVEDRIYRDAA